MSGWIFINSNRESYREGLKRFCQKFDIKGEIPLHFKEEKIDLENRVIFWGWGKDEKYYDVFSSFIQGSSQFIILDGLITDFGVYGDSFVDKKLMVNKFLELWNERKESVISELNGSFSIFLLDTKSNQINCITDRFGSRPVWFSEEKEKKYFGNFPLALAALNKNLVLDSAGLWSLIATSRPVSDRNLFFGIKSVQAGMVMSFEPGKTIKSIQWYTLKYAPDFSLSPKKWGERIVNNLRVSSDNIIKLSSKPYLFLSGGLDSRVAASVFGDRVKTLTLISSANMSSRIAEKVAEALNISHQTIIRDNNWYLDSFNYASLLSGGIYNIVHAHFIKAMTRFILPENGVFILGDMLENFNKHYFKKDIIEKIDEKKHRSLPEFFSLLYSYSHKNIGEVRKLFLPEVGKEIFNDWAEELISTYQKVEKVSDKKADRYDALFRWFNISFCPTNLMHESIKPFAETRNLMLDNNVLKDLLEIPSELKSRGVMHKNILNVLNKKMLWIPNSNYLLPPVVPDRLNSIAAKFKPVIGKARRKVLSVLTDGIEKNHSSVKTTGSWHMLHERFRNDKEYKKYLEDKIFGKTNLPENIFNVDQVRIYWKDFQGGDNSKIYLINMLLTFTSIMDKFPTDLIKYSL